MVGRFEMRASLDRALWSPAARGTQEPTLNGLSTTSPFVQCMRHTAVQSSLHLDKRRRYE